MNPFSNLKFNLIISTAFILLFTVSNAVAQNRNAAKDVTVFQCKDANGANTLVKADSRATSTAVGTHDPQWSISYDNGKTWKDGIEWMTIVADNGDKWQTKIHAEHPEGHRVKLWLENKRPGTNNGKNGPIDVLDWNNKKWQLIFRDGQTDQQDVKFTLSPY